MATPSRAAAATVRFGSFELDLRAQELRKSGSKLKLEGQPLQILALLLERPGEVVTREQLRQQLWPANTYVDFEASINAAVKRLRQVLDDSAETPRYIETLPRRGYRFIYPVQGEAAGDTAAERKQSQAWTRSQMVVASLATALLGIVIVAISAELHRRSTAVASTPPIHSLAVLPLENLTGDEAQDYLVDGIHDELITQVAQLKSLKVISRTSVMRYKRATKPVPEIGRELGVDAVIEGAVRREGDRLHVTTQLIYAPGDRHVWAKSYDVLRQDASTLPGEMALAVAKELGIELTEQERAQIKTAKRVDPAVYDLYLKGKHNGQKWTNPKLWEAVRYFQQAVDLDPTYAPAWAGMGSAYHSLGTFAKGKELEKADAIARAKDAFRHAIELDPTLRGPHGGLGAILQEEGDYESSAREFEAARKADPKWLGPERYLLATGRFDEAIAASRENAERDPLVYNAQLTHGWTLFMAGHYDESIVQLKKAMQLNPDAAYTHFELAWNYIKKSEPDKAVEECDRAATLAQRGDTEAVVEQECAWVYAAAGRRQQALRILSKMPANAAGYLVLARTYDVLGDREQALKYLRLRAKAGKGPSRFPPFLSEGLRADPRYEEMLRKYPQYPPASGALAEVRTPSLPAAYKR